MKYFCLLLCCLSATANDNADLGYSLNIGYAIDVFANYGDLSQVTQVVSAEYEDSEYEESSYEDIEPFREKNIRIFANATSSEKVGDEIDEKMYISFCDTFDDLLDNYFKDFHIEGTDRPWAAFMGNWTPEEILRTFGISYDYALTENCCYVLVKVTKKERKVQLDKLPQNVALKDYVNKALRDLNTSDVTQIRRFMTNYGTHYIDSYVTGNFVYQVFKYKRNGYNLLKSYSLKNKAKIKNENLRFYFSSYFLRHVGDIKIASGNQSVENWARDNLKDSQYLYSRASLIKLSNNAVLVKKLNDLMDNGALLALTLKALKPIFQDEENANKFYEVLDNDLKLWEINT